MENSSIQSCRFYWIFIGFVIHTSLVAQTELHSFEDYYLLSNSNSSEPLSQLSSTDALLIEYLSTDHYGVYDLIKVDSLLLSINPNDTLRTALCSYISAQAHEGFDQIMVDSLSRRSFELFRRIDDVEGAIFSGTLLMQNATQFDGEHLSDYVIGVLEVISSGELKSNFPPAILYRLKCGFELSRLRGEKIEEDKLDSLVRITEQYKYSSPEAYGGFLSGIAVHLVSINNYKKALRISHNVLSHSIKFGYVDFAPYFNIGGIHYTLGRMDSALYYFRKANDLIRKDSTDRVYKLYVSNQVNRGISIIHRELGNSDSSLIYFEIAYRDMVKYYDNVLDQRRVYGDLKFQANVALLEAEELASQVDREKRRKELYTIIIALLVLTVTTLSIFLLSLRYWVKRYRSLARNRERILRIINHDLSGSLTMILQYAKTQVLGNGNTSSKELELFNKDFESSICATEQALSNLMIWGMKSPHRNKQVDGLLDIRESVEEVCNSLNPLLSPKGVVLNIEGVESEMLRTDIYAFQLILRNLILNAIKHCSPHSEIIITGRADGQKRLISIENHTSEENLSRLLEIANSLESGADSNSKVLSEGLGYEMIISHLHFVNGELQITEKGGGVIRTLFVVESSIR